ncbi:MAG: thermonuclease family protein [Planktotalea arctica]
MALISRSNDAPPVRKPPPILKRKVATTPEPFNRSTAKPLQSKPEISGAAYVVDGDTIVIQKTQIRLFGIDAPELDHPFGQKAKWAMVAFCKGQKIRAVITEKDAYDRTVAKCFLPDGRDLSAEMVKIGMAIDWPKFSGGIYRALETPDARKKLWLATARQQGRMHVWEQFEAKRKR